MQDSAEEWVPLAELIRPYLDKPFAKLPKALRERIKNESPWLALWDRWDPEHRPTVARQSDMQNNPALKVENEYWWALECLIVEAKLEIGELEKYGPRSELPAARTRLGLLQEQRPGSHRNPRAVFEKHATVGVACSAVFADESKPAAPDERSPVTDGRRAAPAKYVATSTEQRNLQRYEACVKAGLAMPDNDYEPLPRGIGKVAKQLGITRQTLSEQVKAHINCMNPRQQ